MSKVLVDPAALEEAAKWLEIHSSSSGSAEAFAADALREAIAQPAEAEGVDRWNGLKLAAEVAEEDGPWDPRVGLTDCEAAFAKSASPAVVLELIAALAAVTAERDRLANEAERLRMQLAACGVVAMANTPESAAKSREMHPDYMSASCQDVMRAVDSEMSLRAEVEALRKDAERYRWLRGRLPGSAYRIAGVIYSEGGDGVDAAVDAAMAAKEA